MAVGLNLRFSKNDDEIKKFMETQTDSSTTLRFILEKAIIDYGCIDLNTFIPSNRETYWKEYKLQNSSTDDINVKVESSYSNSTNLSLKKVEVDNLVVRKEPNEIKVFNSLTIPTEVKGEIIETEKIPTDSKIEDEKTFVIKKTSKVMPTCY
jgi:molybdenum cofactor biosynthesis enzyme MoaA